MYLQIFDIFPSPDIPLATIPPIPQELSGPQKQTLIYGYTLDETTLTKLNLSSAEAAMDFVESANDLGLENYYNMFSRFVRDNLHLFYFAIKYPWNDEV